MKKLFLVLTTFIFLGSMLFANNVKVENVTVKNKNIATNTAEITFELSWDNSWKDDINYDAVWVFVKVQNSVSEWIHAKLDIDENNHTLSNPDGALEIGETSGEGIGAFIFRIVPGVGTFTSDVTLLWNYSDEWFDTHPVQVEVIGIEMVYIPEWEFYVGSGGDEFNMFYSYGSNDPYLIDSENEITVGTNAGNLYYDLDNPNSGDQAGPIWATFPKGYKAFYCMKYEITQDQYAKFLNLLNSTQATERYFSTTNSRYSISGTHPNFSSTKSYVACNFLSWADGIAYADWAGLRPMTELEFEKICRLNNYPTRNEFAWGNSTQTQATGISNDGLENEIPTNVDANMCYGNHASVRGPMRVGCFATSSSTQQKSGAGFSGVVEMSGNLWERCVTVGNTTGRNFTGLTGDGALDANGNANVSNWPGTNAIGGGFRGGGWNSAYSACTISSRGQAATTLTTRLGNNGFRCVR